VASAAVLKRRMRVSKKKQKQIMQGAHRFAALQVAMHCNTTCICFSFMTTGTCTCACACTEYCVSSKTSAAPKGSKRETTGNGAAWPLMRLFWQHKTALSCSKPLLPSFFPGGAKKKEVTDRLKSSWKLNLLFDCSGSYQTSKGLEAIAAPVIRSPALK
jgi:hypothetical protein